jgi:hypothetical protein
VVGGIHVDAGEKQARAKVLWTFPVMERVGTVAYKLEDELIVEGGRCHDRASVRAPAQKQNSVGQAITLPFGLDQISQVC